MASIDASLKGQLVDIFAAAVGVHEQITSFAEEHGLLGEPARGPIYPTWKRLTAGLDEISGQIDSLPKELRDELAAIAAIVNEAACNISLGEVFDHVRKSDIADHGNVGWRELIRLTKPPAVRWAQPPRPTRTPRSSGRAHTNDAAEASLQAAGPSATTQSQPAIDDPERMRDFVDLATEIVERIVESGDDPWWEAVESLTAKLETVGRGITGLSDDNFPPFRVVTLRQDDDPSDPNQKYRSLLLGQGHLVSCAYLWADSEVTSGGLGGLWFVDSDGVRRQWPVRSERPLRILRWWIRHIQRRLDRLSTSQASPDRFEELDRVNDKPAEVDVADTDLPDTIDELAKAVPRLDSSDAAQWLEPTKLATAGETAGVSSLRQQRSKGQKNSDQDFGVCCAGRIWRKDKRRVWYYVPSLLPVRDLEEPLIVAARRLISPVD